MPPGQQWELSVAFAICLRTSMIRLHQHFVYCLGWQVTELEVPSPIDHEESVGWFGFQPVESKWFDPLSESCSHAPVPRTGFLTTRLELLGKWIIEGDSVMAVELSLGDCGWFGASAFKRKLPSSFRFMLVAEKVFFSCFLPLELARTKVPLNDSRGLQNNFNSCKMEPTVKQPQNINFYCFVKLK